MATLPNYWPNKSAHRSDQPGLVPKFAPGDVLIVVKLDRLGRNTRDVLNLVHEPEEKAFGCWSLPSIPAGRWARMVLTVLGMVAEMELGFIRDRQRAGINAAKAKGVYKGRLYADEQPRAVIVVGTALGRRRNATKCFPPIKAGESSRMTLLTLPGAAGVGQERAAQLVRRYGTLDGFLEAGLFQTQAEMLCLYRSIATMDALAPLLSLADQKLHGPRHRILRAVGAHQLADRFAEKV